MDEFQRFAALLAELRSGGVAEEQLTAESKDAFRRLLHAQMLTSLRDIPAGKRARILLHRSETVTIFALSSDPGTASDVHDHGAWGLVGQLVGEEVEHVYRIAETDGERVTLALTSSRHLMQGDVTTVLPPARDIHQVVNVGSGVSITLHAFAHDILHRGFTIFQPGHYFPASYSGHWDNEAADVRSSS